jgi:hypothetical protein
MFEEMEYFDWVSLIYGLGFWGFLAVGWVICLFC